MEQPLCAICQKPYRPRYPTEFFCNDCWHTYNSEILSGEGWVTVCVTTERRRRYNERRDAKQLIYIGDEYDIANGRLIKTRFEVN